MSLKQHQPHSQGRLARSVTVAVTGLNATDNPGPGVGVLRSLRATDVDYRLLGLTYDALDPGVYAKNLTDAVLMIPYPSQGVDAFLARLEYIHARSPIDVVIPTLDAELPSFIAQRHGPRQDPLERPLQTRGRAREGHCQSFDYPHRPSLTAGA